MSTGKFIRLGDQRLLEEDEERNAEQAERNAKMRDLLKMRREERAISEVKEEETPPAVDAPPDTQEPAKEAVNDFMALPKLAPVSQVGALDAEQPPWFVARPQIGNAVLRLHEELLDFSDFMKHTPEEILARREWVTTIGKACRALWPECQVRVFGSFFTGLSLPNGDVDIAVWDVPCSAPTAMKLLADHMLAEGEISWLEIIESAKVPVVKLRSQSCGLRADVVINMKDGMETSRFVRERLKEYPQMRPLLVFLKYYLLQRGLHETYTGGMGSYLLSNVVLHFLQRHPSHRDPQLWKSTSLGHLLFDLLKYYGQEFKYESQGISVLHGGHTFPKADRGWGSRKGGGKGGLSLSLESPLDPNMDLGSPCFRIGVLKNLFHHGFHCICHLLVSGVAPEASMLCPLLLDPAHPVITDRYRLMTEQPVALPGLVKRPAPDQDVECKDEDFGLSEVDDGRRQASAAGKNPAKRRRTSAA
mmetsp:Transcript_14255/g.33651  ORF Transcript_14255/g.33651 Transcript_14255/m.33651 type:complete len:475 (-) Transcript_14255:68-1492(-)